MAMSACIHHLVSMSITTENNGHGVKWTRVIMRDSNGNEYEIDAFAENQEEGLRMFFGCKEEG